MNCYSNLSNLSPSCGNGRFFWSARNFVPYGPVPPYRKLCRPLSTCMSRKRLRRRSCVLLAGNRATSRSARPRRTRKPSLEIAAISERDKRLFRKTNSVVTQAPGSVHCSNHSPRGILIRLLEDLCLGRMLAPLFCPVFFSYCHCSSTHRLCLLLSALPLLHQAKNQPAIWKSPLVSTVLPIFPSRCKYILN